MAAAQAAAIAKVDQCLQWIGFANAAHRQAIRDEAGLDSLADFIDVTVTDIRDMAESFAKHSQAQCFIFGMSKSSGCSISCTGSKTKTGALVLQLLQMLSTMMPLKKSSMCRFIVTVPPYAKSTMTKLKQLVRWQTQGSSKMNASGQIGNQRSPTICPPSLGSMAYPSHMSSVRTTTLNTIKILARLSLRR